MTLIGNPLRDAVAPKDAVLRLVAPRKRGGAADADESGDVLGDEEWLYPQFVTNTWLYEATGNGFELRAQIVGESSRNQTQFGWSLSFGGTPPRLQPSTRVPRS